MKTDFKLIVLALVAAIAHGSLLLPPLHPLVRTAPLVPFIHTNRLGPGFSYYPGHPVVYSAPYPYLPYGHPFYGPPLLHPGIVFIDPNNATMMMNPDAEMTTTTTTTTTPAPEKYMEGEKDEEEPKIDEEEPKPEGEEPKPEGEEPAADDTVAVDAASE